jgi:hypothetical protein
MFVHVVVTIRQIGVEWTFTSEPMTEYWADLLLIEIARGPFTVTKARVVPVKEEE